MTTTGLSVSHTSDVTEDQIDELGHMNVRFYTRNSIEGTRAVLERLGIDPGTRVVELYTRHHHEQLLGTRLEVRSGLVDLGERLGIYHELRNAADDDLAATFLHRLDHPPVEAPLNEVPDHGRSRTLDPTAPLVSSAPTLERVRELGLESREERSIDETDTLGADVVPPEQVNGLIWGGVPYGLDGEDRQFVQTLPNGDRMGWATMESMVATAALPRLGTRIQSFGAVTGIGEKWNRKTLWAFDVETEHLLIAFETVAVAFNIDQRRAIAIPDEHRAADEAVFHPEFLPG